MFRSRLATWEDRIREFIAVGVLRGSMQGGFPAHYATREANTHQLPRPSACGVLTVAGLVAATSRENAEPHSEPGFLGQHSLQNSLHLLDSQ